MANHSSQRSILRTAKRTPLSKRFRPCLELLEDRLAPATYIWDGSASEAWSNAANWVGGDAPNPGETGVVLDFPSGAPNQTNLNNIANLNVASITIADDYTLFGNGITLSGNVTATAAIGTAATILLNINLSATRIFDVASGKDLTLGGVLSGASGAGLIKAGAGDLILSGGASNTYAGTTTVNQGSLLLNKSVGFVAIAGPLTVGDESGAGDEVRLLAHDQIGNAVAVNVKFSGLLNLNGSSDAIGSLTVKGNGLAHVQTGAGVLTLNGPITSNASASAATITGNLNFNGAMRNINVGDGTAVDDLIINAIITNGGVNKVGAGRLRLTGNNTYAGATSVSAGTLHVGHAGALGTSAAGTTVASGATLSLETAPAAEPLTLSGKGVGNNGALFNQIGNSNWGGPITLNATMTSPDVFIGGTTDTLTLSGVISGSAGLAKVGNFTLKLAGSAANTYAGATRINEGFLQLAATAVAIPHNLFVGDNVVGSEQVFLQATEQIANGASVTVNNQATLDLSTFIETISSLTLTGGTVTGAGLLILGGNVTVNSSANQATINAKINLGGATRTFNVADGGSPGDLAVLSVISNGGITKTGAGRLVLSAINNYAGATSINAGTLSAENGFALGTSAAGTTVAAGATLEVSQTINGENLTLAGKGVNNAGALRHTAGTHNWTGNVTINSTMTSPEAFIGVDGATTLNISGAIGGTAGLAKVGGGTLSLLGSTANNYAGVTRVNDGVLNLNKAAALAVPHNLIVGDGAGSAETVNLLAAEQILNTATLTVNAAATFDLGAFTETVGPLNLNSASIEGTGTLTLGGNVAATAAAAASLINANLNLGGPTRTFQVGDGPSPTDLQIAGVISNGGLIKTGAGALALSGANTYAGTTNVSAGAILVSSEDALGDTAGGTSVQQGASLVFVATIIITGETLTLSGKGVGNAGALQSDLPLGFPTWGGLVILNATAANPSVFIGVADGDLTLSDVISGAAGLTKVGAGVLKLTGTDDNTYGGVTRINDGTLEVDQIGIAVPHNLIIGDNVGTPESMKGGAIAASATVTVNNQATWVLDDLSATIAGLTLAGGTVSEDSATPSGSLTLTGNITALASSNLSVIEKNLNLAVGTRTITVANGSGATDLLIGAGITNGDITKAGPGTLTLAGSSSYDGVTTVNAGVLRIAHNQALGLATGGTVVANGASLVVAASLAVAEPLTLIGAGAPGFAKLKSEGTTSTWSGPIALTPTAAVAAITVDIDGLADMNFQGVLSGAAGLTKLGGGVLQFSGSSANTYTGLTRVNAGRLRLNKTAGVNAIAGNLVIGDGLGSFDTVEWLADNQIANTAAITLNIAGVLALGGFDETIHKLTVNGGTLQNVGDLTIQ